MSTATALEPVERDLATKTGNRAWRRFCRHRLALFGIAAIVLMVRSRSTSATALRRHRGTGICSAPTRSAAISWFGC
jgi:hypothetical protein